MSDNGGYSGTQVLLAFLGGAAAGAVVALLTAPASGADTRAKLKSFAGDTKDKATRMPRALRGAMGAAKEAFNDALAAQSNAGQLPPGPSAS